MTEIPCRTSSISLSFDLPADILHVTPYQAQPGGEYLKSYTITNSVCLSKEQLAEMRQRADIMKALDARHWNKAEVVNLLESLLCTVHDRNSGPATPREFQEVLTVAVDKILPLLDTLV